MTEPQDDFPEFNPSLWWRNPHLQTLWPALCRRVIITPPERERIETPDDDFLDLDWYRSGNSRLLLITHGLEGHSRRPYVLGLARAALASDWDVLAWNLRSCSGEMNRQPRFYHSGATGDLKVVLNHTLQRGYSEVILAGFSIGGNISLVYLGEQGTGAPEQITGCVVFSVPCDLRGSAQRLSERGNRIYLRRFIRPLREKVRRIHALHPQLIRLDGLDRIHSFHEFDEQYTAPLHGFKGAHDYWHRCSSVRFIEQITIPTLIVNALDDPFLSPSCFPQAEVALNPQVVLETPRFGGHLGFMRHPSDAIYWSESRALAFMEQTAHTKGP